MSSGVDCRGRVFHASVEHDEKSPEDLYVLVRAEAREYIMTPKQARAFVSRGSKKDTEFIQELLDCADEIERHAGVTGPVAPGLG
jgi:hypothetical protein